jgi:hypothetical protein
MGDKPKPKPDVIRKIEKLAKNDKDYGRDSKNNPNNKPNGKW